MPQKSPAMLSRCEEAAPVAWLGVPEAEADDAIAPVLCAATLPLADDETGTGITVITL